MADAWVEGELARLGLVSRAEASAPLPDWLDGVDVDGLLSEAEAAAAEVGLLARFNPNHAPAGPAGGQFTTAATSQEGSQRRNAAARARQKHELRERAIRDRAEAAALSAQIRGLIGRLRAAVANARAARLHAARQAAHARATAKHAKAVAHGKSTKTVHHRRATAAAAAHRKARQAARAHVSAVTALHREIGGLRIRIHALRERADGLDRRAASL